MDALVTPRAPGIVGIGLSRAADPSQAVREAVAGLDLAATRFVQVMAPPRHDLDALAAALGAHLPGVTAFGCTTAGTITPDGYDDAALQLVAFPKSHFRCATLLIAPLAPASIQQIAGAARRAAAQFPRSAGSHRLALVLTDGTSKQEDLLVAALSAGLDGLPLFGGSAASEGAGVPHVLHGRRFHPNAAILALIETDLAFTALGFHHFEPTATRMVVTAAVPEDRLVLELNGAPAAEEYARLVGQPVDRLTPEVFAANPVLVRSDASWHVRAIRAVEPGGALSFLSAIDDGLLLTLGRGKEIVRTIEAGLEPAADAEFVLGFDCYLRKLEIRQRGLVGPVGRALARARVVGFSTFGEQHLGVHVNQTFVGVGFRRTGAAS